MGRKNRDRRREDERDLTPIASPQTARPSGPAPVIERAPRDLSVIEDRRTFHPEGVNRLPRRKTGAPAQFVLRHPDKARRGKSLAQRYLDGLIHQGRRSAKTALQRGQREFQKPQDVLTCVRRQRRKQVIFAKRKQGKGARARRRRNWRSEFSCSTR